MKKILLILFALVGCVSQNTPVILKEKSIVKYCAKGETENCRPWTAGEIAGPTSRGHIDQPEQPTP